MSNTSNVMKIDFKQSLSSIANTVKSIETKSKNDIREIPLSLIKYNSKNKFGIRDVEKLADSLKEYGQLHNAVVRAIDDPEYKFELISGERRHRALSLLGMETILAMVIDIPDDEVAEAMLIITNLETREITDFERSENAVRLAQIVENRKKKGENFGGKKTRVIVSDMMTTEKSKVSPATVQKLFKLQDLIPEFKEMLKGEEIGVEKGNQFAQMTKEQQKLVYEMFEKGKELTASEAKNLKEKFQKEQESFSKVIEEMKEEISKRDKEKEEINKKLKKSEKERLNSEDNLKVLRNNIDELINERKKDKEKNEGELQRIRDKIKSELENEKESQNNKIIEELQLKLNNAIEKDLKKDEDYHIKINELYRVVEEQEVEINKKKLEEKNIQGNIEILAMSKQTIKVLALLLDRVQEYNIEGFVMESESKKVIINVLELDKKLKEFLKDE